MEDDKEEDKTEHEIVNIISTYLFVCFNCLLIFIYIHIITII